MYIDIIEINLEWLIGALLYYNKSAQNQGISLEDLNNYGMKCIGVAHSNNYDCCISLEKDDIEHFISSNNTFFSIQSRVLYNGRFGRRIFADKQALDKMRSIFINSYWGKWKDTRLPHEFESIALSQEITPL